MNNKLTTKTDEELWELLRLDNKDAFSILYKRHVQSLFNFGIRLTTDRDLIKDTLQELFVEFWKKRKNLSLVKHVKVYLIKSFRYKLLRKVSQLNKTNIYSLNDLLFDVPDAMEIESELSFERKQKLKEALKNLPERQREVLHLRFFQNLKNEEIAEIINVNYQSVSNLLYRALKKLKKYLVQLPDQKHSDN